jgi:predicted hydrocarbon binding protein
MQKKIYEALKKSSKERFIPSFGKSFGADIKKEFEITKDFFIASGWGKIDVIDLQQESKRAIIVVENSPFAENLRGKTKNPVDVLTRAIFAGIFSAIFAEDIDCVETECAAQNQERCKFIIKPKTEFDFTNTIVQNQLSHE